MKLHNRLEILLWLGPWFQDSCANFANLMNVHMHMFSGSCGDKNCQAEDGFWRLEVWCLITHDHAYMHIWHDCSPCVGVSLRIRRYVTNVKRSSEEVQKMYNGDAHQRAFGLRWNFTYIHERACMHIHACISCIWRHMHAWPHMHWMRFSMSSWFCVQVCCCIFEASGHHAIISCTHDMHAWIHA